MIYISEALLYVFFSILVGGLFLAIVPDHKKPGINMPRYALHVALFGIVILSFTPLFIAIKGMTTAISFDVFMNLLLFFQAGRAWLWAVGIAFVLFILLILNNRSKQHSYSVVSLLLAIALVFTQGWGSHSASLYQWNGFFAHTVHFLAIVIWVGILLVVGWFAKDQQNWLVFLNWFTPLSIVCVSLSFAAGLMLMEYLSPEYINSWVLSYGQALLIKHLLLIPLLAFAFFNGFIIKKKLSNSAINPAKWFKAESVIILTIFAVTAFMGQQAPPHNVQETLQYAEPSNMFLMLFKGDYNEEMVLRLGLDWISIGLIATSIISLISLYFLFKRKASVILSLMLCGVFLVTAYLALMFSLSPIQ